MAYPQVDLEIVAEDRKVDPVDDNYDLVIRVDPSPDERLVGRRILEDERALVAPPGIAVTLHSEREAVLAGAGAALVPEMMVAEDMDAGRLVLWGV